MFTFAIVKGYDCNALNLPPLCKKNRLGIFAGTGKKMTFDPYLFVDMNYLAINGCPGKNFAETSAFSISSMVVNVV